jgi:hypothetical protein
MITKIFGKNFGERFFCGYTTPATKDLLPPSTGYTLRYPFRVQHREPGRATHSNTSIKPTNTLIISPASSFYHPLWQTKFRASRERISKPLLFGVKKRGNTFDQKYP